MLVSHPEVCLVIDAGLTFDVVSHHGRLANISTIQLVPFRSRCC